MAIIQMKGITKKYGERAILDDFHLEVNQGEYVALMGESGCGKSTLLNIVGLLERFDEGTLIIDENINVRPGSIKANKILRETISYLFQNFALVEEETVVSNLELALKYVDCTATIKGEKIKEALSIVGLDGFEKRKIYELSGGEQQRVAIARIMIKPSKIILADEPTGSLDEKNRDIILDLMKKLNNEGKTIILVTHDKAATRDCSKIITMERKNEG